MENHLDDSNILFFDLEIEESDSNGNSKIRDFGAVLDGKEFHRASGSAFVEFAQGAKYLCGHNIVWHDSKYLKEPRFAPIQNLPKIDSLLISALIRPSKLSHRLEKDYKLRTDSINDPLADAKLCKDLLIDLGDEWKGIENENLKSILYLLTKDIGGISEFFHRLGIKQNSPHDREGLIAVIREQFDGKICSNSELERIIENGGALELAFVLSLLYGQDPQIITPSWMLIQYPQVLRVFRRLRNVRCKDPNCSYCQYYLNLQVNLEQFFHYQHFRSFDGDLPGGPSLQEQAVQAALDDKDFIVLFPTGGGKSLTFQLPALMRGRSSNALTVVISPLVSLMKDQVDGLMQKGITQAVAINGLLSPLERSEAIERVANGTAQLLYISPEALRSKSIANLLHKRIIDRFVIDEAHCFSAWGQDFRVEYLYIAKFIRKLQEDSHRPKPIPISCFTATARKEVVEDIKRYFKERLDRDFSIFQTTQGRKNLQYRAIEVQNEENKMDFLVELLESKQVPTIIYVSRTKTASRLAQSLNQRNIQTVCFHGKMEAEDKKKSQEAFLKGEINTIVATSAFGMGVDKPDVKLVIHYEISSSLENYQQEAGRAGRDPNLQAECIALYHPDDLDRNFELLTGTKLNLKEIDQIWSGIKRFKQERICKSALELAKEAGWDEDMRDLETRVKSAINALEESGYLERLENSTRIFANSLIPKSLELAKGKLNGNHERFSTAQLDLADRILPYLYGPDSQIEVSEMADRTGISLPAMDTLLRQFREIEILKDEQDLSAKLAPKPKEQFIRLRDLERNLLRILMPDGKLIRHQITLRELNTEIEHAGSKYNVGIPELRLVFQYWKKHGFVHSERVSREDDRYKLMEGRHFERELRCLEDRLHLAGLAIDKTLIISKENSFRNTEEGEFWFSLLDLKRRVENEDMFAKQNPRSSETYACVLLYLHDIKSIELRRGMLIYYQRLSIEKKETNNKKKYRQADYEKLGKHYQEKTQQIHFIGEYIKRLVANQAAQTFADDYYQLAHKTFIRKYFPGKSAESLDRPLSEAKFKELFAKLSAEQNEVVRDDSDKILVAAGPGSGKTMVLVHKMASLLFLENVKPENLLVLTFSRTAAREFKERLTKLTPGLGNHVDILTYHAFAFRLLGKLGDLLEADSVVQKATKAIQADEVPMDKVKARDVIMLDEFQDISNKEWSFIQAIVEKAENPRIIAAGDDDQSIYEFRGSSLEAMKELQKDGKTFYLPKNHRSAPILVEFANNFLKIFQSERLKQNHPLEAANKFEGQLNLHRYRGGDLTQSIVDSVVAQPQGITSAVLTTTNHEAFKVHGLLRTQGIPAILVNSQDGFQTGSLREFVEVTNWLRRSVGEDKRITGELWDQAISVLEKNHGQSSNLPLVLKSIELFRQEKTRAYLVDWEENRKMLKMEEVLFPEKDTVLVSTIHKAKGREFDRVYLLLNNYDTSKEENKRVVYVGLTRAKQHLEIHTTSAVYDNLLPIGASITHHEAILPHPQEFETECSMKDVVLSDFERVSTILSVKSVFPGQQLTYDGVKNTLLHDNGVPIVRLSSRMIEHVKKYNSQGFQVKAATVEHAVEWRGINEDGTYRQAVMVVLPRIKWGR